MPNPSAFLNPDLRRKAFFQAFHMADDADHLAAGVQGVEGGLVAHQIRQGQDRLTKKISPRRPASREYAISPPCPSLQF